MGWCGGLGGVCTILILFVSTLNGLNFKRGEKLFRNKNVLDNEYILQNSQKNPFRKQKLVEIN